MKFFFFFYFSLNAYAAESNPVVNPNVFYDKDGDTITILDAEARKTISAKKEIKATHVYDNQAEIEKFKTQYEKDVLTDKKKKYGYYTVAPGDQLKRISQKVYGTAKRSNELLLLNEGILKNDNVKVGMKLKYIIEEKEIPNGH